MANYFTLNGYSLCVCVCGGVIGKPSYNNSENYKDKYFECLICAGHFQCLHFRHFGVLKLQHVNYRYRKPQTQYLSEAYSMRSLKYYQFELSFRTHKRNLRYLAKAKYMVKTVKYDKSSQKQHKR